MRFFFGRDVFVSYAHENTDYACALATALIDKGYDCVLDQSHAIVQDEIPKPVLRALQDASMMVLVGTQAATKSSQVDKEFETFKQTERPLKVINVAGALEMRRLRTQDLKGARMVSESATALKAAQPSAAVLKSVLLSAKFVTLSNRRRRASWAAFGIFCVLVSLNVTSFLSLLRLEGLVEDTSIGLGNAASSLASSRSDRVRALVAALEAAASWHDRYDKAPVPVVEGLVAAVRYGREAQLIEGFVGISADFQMLATANDENIELWRLETGELIGSVPREGPLAFPPRDSIAYGSDNQCLSSASLTFMLRTKPIEPFTFPQRALLGGESKVERWDLSGAGRLSPLPSGTNVVSANGNLAVALEANTLRAFDPGTGEELWWTPFKRQKDDEAAKVGLLRNDEVVSVHEGASVVLYDAETGDQLWTVLDIDGAPMALTNDDILIAARSPRGPVSLRTRSGGAVALGDESQGERFVAWSDKSGLLVIGDRQDAPPWHLWRRSKDASSFEHEGVLHDPDPDPRMVQFAQRPPALDPRGVLLITGGGPPSSKSKPVEIWDVRTGARYFAQYGQLQAIAPEGGRIAVVSRLRGVLHPNDFALDAGVLVDVWRPGMGVAVDDAPAPFTEASFLPGGSEVLLKTAEDSYLVNADSGAPLRADSRPVGEPPAAGDSGWLAHATLASAASVDGSTPPWSTLAYSPDGARVATLIWRQSDKRLVLTMWHAKSRNEDWSVELRDKELSMVVDGNLAFRPDDGAHLVLVGANSVDVWDVATGTRSHRLCSSGIGVRGASYSPGGERLACVDGSGKVTLFDGAKYEFLAKSATAVAGVVWSPDGLLLACPTSLRNEQLSGRTGALALIDGSTGWLIATMQRKGEVDQVENRVRSVDFAPDGSRLVSVDGRGRAFVWDLPRPIPATTEGLVREAVVQLRWTKEFDQIDPHLRSLTGDSTSR